MTVQSHIWGKVNNNITTTLTEVKMCTVDFTNRYWFDTQGVYKQVVFILNEENIQKFYYWEYHNSDQVARLSEYTNVQVGYIEILEIWSFIY